MYCIDSSIRFFNNKTDLMFKKVLETRGIGFILTWRVSIFAVTMNETANYLITDKNKQKSTMQSLAGIILIYRTREIYENILRWAILCALEEECISKGTKNCNTKSNTTWAGCSQFDQTALNIVSSNYFGFIQETYTLKEKSVDVKRHSSGHHFPTSCIRLPFSHNDPTFLETYFSIGVLHNQERAVEPGLFFSNC